MRPAAVSRTLRLASLLTAVLAWPDIGHATNWLMLDATEPPGAPAFAGTAFLSLQYLATNDTPLLAGRWRGQPDQFNRFAPDYAGGRVAQLPTAGLGVHGRLLEGTLNYRATLLTGQNALLRDDIGFYDGWVVRPTDASVTVNAIPGLRLRLGMFRQPLGDEAMAPQPRFIWLSHVSQQMVQERYFRSDGSVNGNANRDLGPVSGFRDIGLQVFDAFTDGAWEHTYAAMVGAGTGVDPGLNRTGLDAYGYWSSEWILGGTGPRREGLKLFGWAQAGERSLDAGPSQARDRFARQRAGIGATLRAGAWTVCGEYIAARGMIYNGPDGGTLPGHISNDGTLIAGYNVLPSSRAQGWYLDLGYRVLEPLEVRLRYDVLNRGTDSPSTYIRFQALSVGVAYQIGAATQVLATYQFRTYAAPRLPSDSPTNLLLDGVDHRFGIRLTHQFTL